jgi:hypothetical protein
MTSDYTGYLTAVPMGRRFFVLYSRRSSRGVPRGKEGGKKAGNVRKNNGFIVDQWFRRDEQDTHWRNRKSNGKHKRRQKS